MLNGRVLITFHLLLKGTDKKIAPFKKPSVYVSLCLSEIENNI